MSKNMSDKQLQDHAKALLENKEQQLSPEIARGLRSARKVALLELEAKPRSLWLPASGLAMAASLVVALLLNHSSPQPNTEFALSGQQQDVVIQEDIDFQDEVVLQDEDPELLEDLEFYQWLVTVDESQKS